VVLIRSAVTHTWTLLPRFSADPAVTAASPNYWRCIDAMPPDDPGLAAQWGLLKAGVPDAWRLTTGSPDVVIASLDTGVGLLHQGLYANLWHNPDEALGNGIDDDHSGYVDDVYGIDAFDHDSVPMDDHGHGTHTSGATAGSDCCRRRTRASLSTATTSSPAAAPSSRTSQRAPSWR